MMFQKDQTSAAWGKGRNPVIVWSNQVSGHFVRINQWRQTVEFIIYETKKKNVSLEGLCLAASYADK